MTARTIFLIFRHLFLSTLHDNRTKKTLLSSLQSPEMKIEILSTQSIKPSSPTPQQLRDFKLSIDERIPPHYTPLILYYTWNEGSNVDRSEMSRRLKCSLSEALAKFYPLAGRTKGQILVDCNDEGALYVEASGDGSVLDIVRSPRPRVLAKLIPFVIDGYVSSAQELLGVQITTFSCGGMAVGVCVSHRIADGSTLSSFIRCWAAVAACRDNLVAAAPLFNSAALFPPRNTPDFTPNSSSPSIQPLSPNLITERFIFPSSAIETLKLEASTNSSIPNPTRVKVVSAFIWHRAMAAKGLKESVSFHSLNLRGKIPALSENSFGNLFQMMKAESKGETSWTQLVEKLRSAFERVDDEYKSKLLGEKGYDLAKENFKEISGVLKEGNVEVFRFSSCCKFAAYEADFGWGKPIWVSNTSCGNKNCVSLFDSVEWSGGIEAWMVMTDQDMARLLQDLEFMTCAFQ